MRDADLISLAGQAREQAYAPYSRFRVGAALLAADGRVFVGCNVENAAYPLSMCAERVALYRAVAEGAREFTAMAVVTDAAGPVTACGGCRQVLAELAPGARLLFAGGDGAVFATTVAALLPHGFSATDLPG